MTTFEERRATMLRREARALELKAVQMERLGETDLAAGLRDVARQLDTEAATLKRSEM